MVFGGMVGLVVVIGKLIAILVYSKYLVKLRLILLS